MSPFLTARWRHLAMANYGVDPDLLAPYVPAGTELDYFHGRTFISLVGFLFHDTRLGGRAVPCHGKFEEVNLRFYVRRRAEGEIRRGVVFIKEIVARRAVAAVARWAYGENYAVHAMRHAVAEEESAAAAAYQWRLRGRWNRIRVEGEGPKRPPDPGSEEHFIIEHYWGYTRLDARRTVEYRVAHPAWHVWQNCRAEVDCDAAALYGPPFAAPLSAAPASVLLADGSAVAVYRPQRLTGG